MLCQINIVVEVANKHFEVLAMIQEDTQLYDKYDSASDTWSTGTVSPGPALRAASGKEHIKFAMEQGAVGHRWSSGSFPPDVAAAGALVRVQDAEASWPCDKTTILNHIVESAHPNSEPPTEHANYDKMNSAVQGLFRGAAWFAHASSGNAQGLRALLSGGTAGVDYQDPSGKTPAWNSAAKGHTECLQVLAECKADLNKPYKGNGATPAFESAYYGKTESLQLLANYKADLNQPLKDGTTPAYISAARGYTECLQLLAERKADLNQPHDDGTTPAYVSARKGHTDCLQLLADCKADLNQPANNGQTPAYVSASKGHTDCLQLLANCKADLNQPDNNGRTPAYMSSKEGQTASIQVLINHKADTNQECQGYTPLKLAEEFGHSAMVEILLVAGAR